jgi:hypothetical protein
LRFSTSRHRLVFQCGVASIGCLAMPAFAQDGVDVDALQRVIEAQQGQIEAQQKQLETLQTTVDGQAQLLREFQSQIESLRPDSPAGEVAVAAAQPAATSPPDAGSADTDRRPPVSNKSQHDLDSPTNSNVTYFGSSRRAMMPDSPTEVGVHGLIEFQMFHDTTGLDNNRFDTASIPVDGGPSQTKFNVNPTQFAASSVTPVSSGEINTWFSIDMNGELDRPSPRLRIAFAEYVDYDSGWAVLGGQTYSTMLDLGAVPETLDFALPAGLWQQRQPLLRFSKSISELLTAEVSVETPENVTYIEAEKRTRLPDFAAAGTWRLNGENIKHLRLAALVRDLRVEGETGATDSALGWSISGSTKVALPFLGARDNLKWTMHVGDGYGTQLKGGPAEGIFNEDTSQLETISIFGTYGGVQHFWSDRFRSNLVLGYVDADNPAFADGNIFMSTSYLAADIIWSPFPTSTLGFEYLWGRREDENGESGTSSRYLLSSKFEF